MSAGIACNKLLAKVGAGMNKPNQQTVIPTRCRPLRWSGRANHAACMQPCPAKHRALVQCGSPVGLQQYGQSQDCCSCGQRFTCTHEPGEAGTLLCFT